ncbi:hypothetical protein ACFSKU_21710 [Pontibacter silvestris]|uniref:Uncharacterized protein n=1 Tax=Pontibacter silvestris TaxID=2305183 RepID=A0ABW4X3H0_9BACT|nr:hypothetical protein [Pontibacter silvestris]MCC9138335.1 hypothetical protein [Pontibacter silvestris]
MKKLLLAGTVVLGSLSLYSCGGNEGASTTSDNEMVIDQDTAVSEYEVDRTVVETDTTTESQTIEADSVQQ